jgi:hypothetical protein
MRRTLALYTAAAALLAVAAAPLVAQNAASSGAAAPSMPRLETVPPELLQGTKLVDTAANFSLEEPAAGWTWSQSVEPGLAVTYVATDAPHGRRFMATVMDHEVRRVDAGVLAGIKRGLASHATLTSPFVQVQVPQGAKHIRYDKPAGDAVLHCDAYVVATGRAVILQHCSTSTDAAAGDEEARLFSGWLASFHTLHRVPAAPTHDKGLGYSFLIALLVGLGISSLINALRGRMAINGWIVGAGAAALVFVLYVWRLYANGLDEVAVPGEMSEYIFEAVGYSLPTFLIAFFGARSFQKRKARRLAPSPTAPAMSPP